MQGPSEVRRELPALPALEVGFGFGFGFGLGSAPTPNPNPLTLTLTLTLGLPCDADALKASATGFGSEVLARCKGQVKPDGSYMRCLLSRWGSGSGSG